MTFRHVCMHVHKHACMHAHAHAHTHAHTYIHTHTHTHTRIHTRTHIHTHAHTHAYTHTQTHARTHTHTHTHACTPTPPYSTHSCTHLGRTQLGTLFCSGENNAKFRHHRPQHSINLMGRWKADNWLVCALLRLGGLVVAAAATVTRLNYRHFAACLKCCHQRIDFVDGSRPSDSRSTAAVLAARFD